MNTFKFGQVGQVVIFPNNLADVCASKRCVVTEDAILDMLNEQSAAQERGTFHIAHFDYNVVTGTERYAILITCGQARNLKMAGYIDTEEVNKGETSNG